MSSGSTGLAGRYAAALYALAVDSSKVDSIHAELGRLSDLIDESQDLMLAWKGASLRQTGQKSLEGEVLVRQTPELFIKY